MRQSKRHSFAESLCNVAIGYLIALASQLVIFPLYGVHVPLSSNIYISLWFTGVSIIRSYCIRRFFTRGIWEWKR